MNTFGNRSIDFHGVSYIKIHTLNAHTNVGYPTVIRSWFMDDSILSHLDPYAAQWPRRSSVENVHGTRPVARTWGNFVVNATFLNFHITKLYLTLSI